MHCTPPILVRDRLLDSAEQLVATIGGAKLTLEAVAEKAGVSKGGLLYHYRSKEALLLALVHRHLERTDQRYFQVRQGLPDGPARDLKAWILALLQPDPLRDAAGAAIFAAAVNKPELLAGIRRHYAARIKTLARLDCDFPLAATIVLAVDGLLLGEVWRITPFTDIQRARILEQLLSLADRAFDSRPKPEPATT